MTTKNVLVKRIDMEGLLLKTRNSSFTYDLKAHRGVILIFDKLQIYHSEHGRGESWLRVEDDELEMVISYVKMLRGI